MECGEDGKFVRVIEVQPIEIKCAECGTLVGEALEDMMAVYCEDCYNEIKSKMENLEGRMDEIKELVEEE